MRERRVASHAFRCSDCFLRGFMLMHNKCHALQLADDVAVSRASPGAAATAREEPQAQRRQ